MDFSDVNPLDNVVVLWSQGKIQVLFIGLVLMQSGVGQILSMVTLDFPASPMDARDLIAIVLNLKPCTLIRGSYFHHHNHVFNITTCVSPAPPVLTTSALFWPHRGMFYICIFFVLLSYYIQLNNMWKVQHNGHILVFSSPPVPTTHFHHCRLTTTCFIFNSATTLFFWPPPHILTTSTRWVCIMRPNHI